jgi:predicted nucleotide-binding protein (sugar kinase/HSP70/actin superfamily)
VYKLHAFACGIGSTVVDTIMKRLECHKYRELTNFSRKLYTVHKMSREEGLVGPSL